MARKNKQRSSASSSSSSSKSSPYAAAANLLNQILEERKSFKKLVYNASDGSLKCSKTTYAQVCQVLSYKPILDQLLEDEVVPKLKREIHNTGLLHVLVYELLFGPNKAIKGGGVVKRKILQHHQALQKALQSNPKIARQLEAKKQQQLQQQSFPRYARVNTLLTTTEQVCRLLKPTAQDNQEEPSLEFYVDAHVPDLLVFPPSLVTHVMSGSSGGNQEKSSKKNDQTTTEKQTVLSRQQDLIREMIQSGKLILQDKSSCFPALCLVHGFRQQPSKNNGNDKSRKEMEEYLDACAAPGNKTQHLAALLQAAKTNDDSASEKKKTKRKHPTIITALDRDPTRLASLSKRMLKLVPNNNSSKDQNLGVKVITKEADFLEETNNKKSASSVGAILLDPSCSGSGIYTAPDRWTEQQDNSSTEQDEQCHQRIESLASFQEKALRHAMSFPSVSRIVYSTCSLHDRENELVVQKALAAAQTSTEKEKEDGQWRIIAPGCLEQWKSRGHLVEGLSEQDAACMIRACAKDETNGFFVCCLERRRRSNNQSAANERDAEEETPVESLVAVPSGMAIYSGQFSPSSSSSSSTSEKKGDQASKQQSREWQKSPVEGSPGNPRKQATNERTGSSSPQVETVRKEVAETAVSKKKAKKLAWKKRQMEQKQERLKQKKQKASNG